MTEDELDRIVVGDVLKTPGGDYRVVRRVSGGPKRGKYPDRNYYFVFAIRRCSWTGRADTFRTRTDIRDWQRVGVRVRLDSELDRQFADDLLPDHRLTPALRCCDVRAMP